MNQHDDLDEAYLVAVDLDSRHDPDCHLGTLRTIDEREAKERAELFKGLYEENEEAFWKLVKFEAEHEQDRLDYYEDLDELERQKRKEARLARQKDLPPLPKDALTLEDALERLENVRLSGSFKWRAKCPVHGGDARPLLIVDSENRPGTPYFHCFAGCDHRDIRKALQ